MIITVEFIYRHAATSRHFDQLEIRAWHAYRDKRGLLRTASVKREVQYPHPQNFTEGLRQGTDLLHRYLSARSSTFVLADEADLEDAAWRLVG